MSNNLRILLADDSRFFRAIESQFLKKTPVDILEVDGCEMALAVMRREKPDLVYMAFALPDDGGATCCQMIKADSELRHIPVVMICDQNEPEQPEIARQKGCDACLVKPLDRRSFLQAGRQFIAKIREYRQPSFFPVTITANGEDFNSKCLDISGGGMFVEIHADIPIGTLVTLSFKLPDSLVTQITCAAEVSWPNRKPTPLKPHYPNGLGLKFIDLSAPIYKAILRLADKKPFG